MAADLRNLLDSPELALTLLIEQAELPAGALERTVNWVHSSDLADPTPFLSDGQVLLTTGTQFGTDAAVDAAQAEGYIARLVAHGIAGLGFGTEVVRAGTPEALAAAARRHGLPLFEVPYRTPFIAVVRANADELARAANARSRWALAAQRAISIAATRPDGLSATLAELSRQLGCWVGLLDASGELTRGFPLGAVDEDELEVVRGEAAQLLLRRRRASRPVTTARHGFTLQTLGAGEQLRGVLAIAATDELDQAGREVITSVIALASLALQQNRELDRAHGLLRTGLLRMLMTGDPGPAETTSAQLWGSLPAEPIRVAVLEPGDDEADAVTEALELWVQSHPGRLFFATDDAAGPALVLCVADGELDPVRLAVERYGLRAGLSAPSGYAGFARARAQAGQALHRGAGGGGAGAGASAGGAGIVEFGDLVRDGVLAFLANGDARELARSALAPLAEHDEAHGGELMRSVRLWLENGCRYDDTARALGVHRHTARARVELAGRLLGRELDSFTARAELWAAYVALG